MYTDLTKKELEIFEFIKYTISVKGYPPTVREICDGVDLKSPSSVHGYLERLENKGYITRASMKTRAISISEPYEDNQVGKKQTIDIPVLGKVSAGEPILALENIEDYLPVREDQAKDKDLFFLKIDGDSMIDVGIFSDDYVLVEQRSSAKNGDIVLALIDDSATVKTFYKENGRYRLQPENETMDPIYTDKVEVLGHVIGLYRMF